MRRDTYQYTCPSPAPILGSDNHYRVCTHVEPPGPKWPFRWDLLLRYRFIETLALWEGRLTTRHLCDTFGIGRQQASKDINNYMREVGPGNLQYDKFLKGYKPTPAFEPRVTQGLADEYLHLMARNNELMNVFESLSLNVANVEVLSLPVTRRQTRGVAPHHAGGATTEATGRGLCLSQPSRPGGTHHRSPYAGV